MNYECPNCHCDNQDMFTGMGKNMMYCEACDHEFHETNVILKNAREAIDVKHVMSNLIDVNSLNTIRKALEYWNDTIEWDSIVDADDEE